MRSSSLVPPRVHSARALQRLAEARGLGCAIATVACLVCGFAVIGPAASRGFVHGEDCPGRDSALFFRCRHRLPK